jgi:hypothetical protein
LLPTRKFGRRNGEDERGSNLADETAVSSAVLQISSMGLRNGRPNGEDEHGSR